MSGWGAPQNSHFSSSTGISHPHLEHTFNVSCGDICGDPLNTKTLHLAHRRLGIFFIVHCHCPASLIEPPPISVCFFVSHQRPPGAFKYPHSRSAPQNGHLPISISFKNLFPSVVIQCPSTSWNIISVPLESQPQNDGMGVPLMHFDGMLTHFRKKDASIDEMLLSRWLCLYSHKLFSDHLA
jgi:hypothetical protein